jgi:hypothetical protein
VNWSAELVAEVPSAVVTVTSTGQAPPAGDVAVTSVGDTTVTPVAGFDPKRTVVAGVNSFPVIVTGVPPVAGPDDGATEVTVGAVSVMSPIAVAQLVDELLEYSAAMMTSSKSVGSTAAPE